MSEHPVADGQTMMAYLDGELADAEVHALEGAVAADTALERRLRDLAFADAMLRASVRTLAASGGQTDAALPGKTATIVPITSGRFTRPRAIAAGLAAGLVLALAAGALGYAMRAVVRPPELAATTAGARTVSEAALQAGLEGQISGRESTWRDPVSGLSGGLVPVRTWQTEQGRFCREFEAWQGSGDARANEHGVACREARGQWRVRVRYYPD